MEQTFEKEVNISITNASSALMFGGAERGKILQTLTPQADIIGYTLGKMVKANNRALKTKGGREKDRSNIFGCAVLLAGFNETTIASLFKDYSALLYSIDHQLLLLLLLIICRTVSD